MNGPDHYREAERLLDEAISRGDFNPRAEWCLELAKLHTALAHVADIGAFEVNREAVTIRLLLVMSGAAGRARAWRAAHLGDCLRTRPAVRASPAGHAVGYLPEDVDVAVVPCGLLDQVEEHPSQGDGFLLPAQRAPRRSIEV